MSLSPYNGPVYQAREQDRVPELILRGAENLGAGISSGLGAVGKKLEEARQKRGERDFIGAQWEAMAPAIESLPDGADLMAKFAAGGLNQQRGLLTGVQARIHEQEKAIMPQYQKTPGGSGFYFNPKTGAITPEREINPPMPTEYTTPGGTPGIVTAGGQFHAENEFTPDLGEWRPDESGTVLRHWTQKRGFTGAQYPAKGAGAPPRIRFVVDEQSGKGAYLDDNGDVIDPNKLVDYEDVPGTGKPEQTMPLPMIPGMPPGITVKVPGTGTPPQRRIKPQDAKPTPPQRFQVFSGPQGTVRRGPDGTEQFLQWDEKGVPSWIDMNSLPSTGLLPPVPGVEPAGNILVNPNQPQPVPKRW